MYHPLSCVKGKRHKTERDEECHTIYLMRQSLENVFGNDEERKRVNKQSDHSFKDLLIKTGCGNTHLQSYHASERLG